MFYESGGKVKFVKIQDALHVTVGAALGGEGERWDIIDEMVLSPSRDQLTVKSKDGTDFLRYRCRL